MTGQTKEIRSKRQNAGSSKRKRDGDDDDFDNFSKKPTGGDKFEHSCTPKRLVELCLTPDQQRDVRAIGFGSLLSLEVKVLPLRLVQFLVERFEPITRIQQIDSSKEYVITTSDVFDIFCLPRNVANDKVNRSSSENMELRKRYFQEFGQTKDGLPAYKLMERISELHQGGDEFKRLFVLFVFGIFLAPVVTKTIDVSLLSLVEDVSHIRKFDWCQYVLDKLCEGITRFKLPHKNSKNCSGCVMVLVIAYLHRFPFQGLKESTVRPLIQHWNANKFKLRIDSEAKVGWGMLIFSEEDVYPISAFGEDFVDDIRGDVHEDISPLMIESGANERNAESSNEHEETEPRRYETRSRRSLLAQCTWRASPELRGLIRYVKGIASPSSALTTPKTGMIETTPASDDLNLVVPPAPQVRTSTTSISRSNQVESSKTSNLPPTGAGIEEVINCATNILDTLQESSPLIPPSAAAHGVAPELLSLPANRASEINENQSVGSCINGNGHNRGLARTSSLNCTQIVEMLDNSGDDEVDPALVTDLGYRVKEEVAPLLRSILLKYGDIAKHSSLQSVKGLSMHLEMMCDIYLNLEKKNLKDVASWEIEIKGILAEVADLEAAKLDVGWLRKRLEDISKALEERKRYKAWKDEGARKNVREEMLVKELEESRKRTQQQEFEAEKSRKKTQQLDSEVEESRKKNRRLEIEVAATQAEKKICEEAIANSRAKIEFLKRPLVDGLL